MGTPVPGRVGEKKSLLLPAKISPRHDNEFVDIGSSLISTHNLHFSDGF